jgi:hypothetical protein
MADFDSRRATDVDRRLSMRRFVLDQLPECGLLMLGRYE